MKKSLLALTVSLVLAAPAMAAGKALGDPQLKALDARIRALEDESQKLREQAAQALAEASAARAELDKMKADQAAQAVAAPAAAPAQSSAESAVAAVSAPAGSSSPSGGGANGNAFNPAIAVILNGNYAHHSENPDRYVRAGFPVVPDTGPGPQGLSLGESEISFAANIDDKFYGQFTVSYHDDNGDVGTESE